MTSIEMLSRMVYKIDDTNLVRVDITWRHEKKS